MNELDQIKKRYHKRNNDNLFKKYSLSSPYIYMSRQEKERKLYGLLNKLENNSLEDLTLLEIGCGRGDKIIDLLQMGFSPEHIIGNELINENIKVAGQRLPSSIKLYSGDARKLPISQSSLDIVYQSMVFSSILEDTFQEELANTMWKWIKPNGGILWYDFIYNNPCNKDVRRVPLTRIKELFPEADIFTRKVTLAPPISRRVTKIHPSMYTLFNSFPFLRTHILCFIQKPVHLHPK